MHAGDDEFHEGDCGPEVCVHHHVKVFDRGGDEVGRAEASADVVHKNVDRSEIGLGIGSESGGFGLVAEIGNVCPNIYPRRSEFIGSLVQAFFAPGTDGDIYAFRGECEC